MGRHQSLERSVKKSLKWLESNEGVAKVVIGISECCRHKYPPGYLKFKMDVDAGLTLNAYSGNGVTDLFIKIEPIELRESVKEALQWRFNRS